MGRNLGVSGAPWEAILTPRDGPWEQQDGHEVANDMICVDFEVISGLFMSVSGVQNALKTVLCLGLFPEHIFIDFGLEFSTFGTSKSLFSH